MSTMQSDTIVYAVDDDASMAAALVDLLASVALSCKTFGSTQEFLNFRRPDVASCLILDVRMPGQSGMDFLTYMGDAGIRIPTIVITGHGDIEMGVKAMKSGAVDFLPKPFRDQDLLDAVQVSLESDRRFRQNQTARAALELNWASLNQGERDVTALVAQGQLNKQIAGTLNVSEITVKVRRANAMRKLGARTLPDLVRMIDLLQTN